MKDFFVEDILEKFEDYTQPVNQGPGSMDQEPRNMYVAGGVIKGVKKLLTKTVKPSILRREAVALDLNQINSISKNKEFEQAWKNYKISIKDVGRRKYSKDKFFEMWARENMAQGGRIGLKGGSDAKTGMGFQKGHNFGRDLKGKPSLNVQGKNQYANSMTVKEIQAIIDANPDVEYPKNFVAKGLLPRRQIDNNIENLVFKKQGTPKADPAKVTARNTKRNEARIRLEGRGFAVKSPEGYQLHHIMPLAGNEKLNTGDYAVVSKEMNAKMSKYNVKINKLVNEAYGLDFNKTENLKKLDKINNDLFDILETVKKDLPKEYKGLLGFNKLTPVLDTFDDQGKQLLFAEPQGIDYKKSIAGSKGLLSKDVKTSDIQKLVNEAPKSEIKNQIKIFKKMGFRCNKAGGGAEDVACYLEDVKKTKADARSSDVLKRAKALTKERKALQVAKTLPKIGNIIRKGVQVGAGAVSSALSAVGLGPVGLAIEAAIEGGFYDNARRNGYTHEQAYAETFLPKAITDAAGTTNTGTGLFEGAESLIEKEKLGKEDSLASQFNNSSNIFDQETRKLDNMVSSYMQLVEGKQKDDLLEKIYLQEDKVKNLINTIKPGTPAYEAYQIAEENQTGRMENRKQDYLSMNRIPYMDAQGNMQEKTFPLSPAQIKQQESKLQSRIKSGDKRRDKEMAEYKTGYEGTLEPFFLKENEKANFSGAYGDGPDQEAKKWKDIFEGGGAYDLTDKIGIAGGVSKMATGGLANLMKKYYD